MGKKSALNVALSLMCSWKSAEFIVPTSLSQVFIIVLWVYSFSPSLVLKRGITVCRKINPVSSARQVWTTARTSLATPWWAFTKGSASGSWRPTRTTCHRCRRWRSSSWERSRWVPFNSQMDVRVMEKWLKMDRMKVFFRTLYGNHYEITKIWWNTAISWLAFN